MTKALIRHVMAEDTLPLAHLWRAQWIRAHSRYVPKALTLLRTDEEFQRRLTAFGQNARTAGPIGAPLGFCAILGAEIDQIYVDETAQGTGLADLLLTDGERRIAAAGHKRARLACVKENLRAQRFYMRNGWARSEVAIAQLDTSDGPFPLEVMYFEKDLT
ncbi:GNAT family N-acetyltransferase [Aliiroseovarius crassostreae]|uniref:GNAT family N-acetyltransferase n=1 Tax=Aliiroseovarius crassostreae TaxID=154981 RepID=UPI0021FEAF0D|nr:GNAT family N-acetyltransferase [Aliiroseovarius crassostreae]UWQ10204.1 GNAT family N-acetyltransferase [Aliiroseovarius crassostreae]